MASGYGSSQDDAHSGLVAASGNLGGGPATPAFFDPSGASFVNAGMWPALPDGVPRSHPLHAPLPQHRAQFSGALPPTVSPIGPLAAASVVPTPRRPSGRRSRASSPRPRSASPQARGSSALGNVEPVAATDAGQDELTLHDVVGMVKRSFATVRGALTEQRTQSTDLARQVAVGMAKIDALAVALDQSVARHIALDERVAAVDKKLDDILARLDGNSEVAETPEEDPDAWIADVRVCCGVVLVAFVYMRAVVLDTAWTMDDGYHNPGTN